MKASKFRTLNTIQRALNDANFEKDENILENYDYKKEIDNAASPEEVEVIREEVLLKITEKSKKYKQIPTEKTKIIKNYFNDNKKPTQGNNKTLEKLVQELTKMNDNKDSIRSLEEQLAQSKQQTKEIAEQLNKLRQTAALETQKLKKEIQNSKQKSNFN